MKLKIFMIIWALVTGIGSIIGLVNEDIYVLVSCIVCFLICHMWHIAIYVFNNKK